MKVTMLVSHLELRTDLRELIKFLSQRLELTVIHKGADYSKPNVNAHTLSWPHQVLSLKDKVATKIFELFGSQTNHPQYRYRYNLRLIHKLRGYQAIIQRIKSEIAYRWPIKFSYDSFADNLTSHKHFDELEADVVVAVTDVIDTQAYNTIRNSTTPLLIYVTSWDHAPKFNKFFRQKIRYLVWSKSMAEDITKFHSVNSELFDVVGSGQLSFIHDFLNTSIDRTVYNDIPPIKDRYIFFPAAYGYPGLVEQELNFIRQVADIVKDCEALDYVYVRPYPLLKLQSAYDALLDHPCIRLDRTVYHRNDELFTRDSIYRKLTVLKSAAMTMHLGTTMGLEAAYFDKPILTIAGSHWDDPQVSPHLRLSKSLNQFHIQKYFTLDESYDNVILNQHQLEYAVLKAAYNPGSMMDYNSIVKSRFPLRGSDSWHEAILSAIQKSVLTSNNIQLATC